MTETIDKLSAQHKKELERLTKKQSQQKAIIAAHLDKMTHRNH